MHKIDEIVKSLSVDVEAMIARDINSKESYSALLKENEELKQIIKQHKNEIEELKDKNKLIKIAKSLEGDNSGKGELKYKINEILREVDRCMALLNK